MTVSIPSLIVLAAVVSTCPAQDLSSRQDPGGQGGMQDEAKAVIKKIRAEMEEIDKLLDQARGNLSSGADKAGVKEALETTLDSNKVVLDQIQKLLDLAQQQQQQQQQQQRRPQQQRPQQQRNQRRPQDRQKGPELVEQQQTPEQNRPENNQPNPPTGQNIKTAKPIDDKTARYPKGNTANEWGNLPEYLRAVFKKGGVPRTPGKYGRFVEEFFKNVDKKNGR